MACITPTRPLESSAKRILKRVHMCTERSFERTPIRNVMAKRKTVQILSSTLSSGITLLSAGEHTLVANSTITDQSYFTVDQTLTERNKKVSGRKLPVDTNNQSIVFRVSSTTPL